MKLVDVNVLVYAVHRQLPQHPRVLAWWESLLASGEEVGLCWPVLSGFLRVVTNPRWNERPLAEELAIGCVTSWLDHGSTRLVAPSPTHWAVFQQLIRETNATGNLVSDAHLAAIAIGNGAKLASCDTDFARFSKLRWINPLVA